MPVPWVHNGVAAGAPTGYFSIPFGVTGLPNSDTGILIARIEEIMESVLDCISAKRELVIPFVSDGRIRHSGNGLI